MKRPTTATAFDVDAQIGRARAGARAEALYSSTGPCRAGNAWGPDDDPPPRATLTTTSPTDRPTRAVQGPTTVVL